MVLERTRSPSPPWKQAALLALALLVLSCAARGRGGDNGNIEGDLAGECSDGADNDQDGLYDCLDPDCALSTDCSGGGDDDTQGDDDTHGDDDTSSGESDCANAIDDDSDGLTDCDDPDCAQDDACGGSGDDDDTAQQEYDCSNDIDDDSDGLTDCSDPDCAQDDACNGSGDDDDTTAQEYNCANDIDDDSDGLTDCFDPDCALDAACSGGDDDDNSPGWEGNCDDGQDEDQDGLTDCEDPDCFADAFCNGDGVSCTPTRTLACPAAGTTLLTHGDTVIYGTVNIDLYACSTMWSQGPEVAYEFSSATDMNVELYLVSLGNSSWHRTFLVEDHGNGCMESDCIDDGDSISFRAAPGTTYYFVVESINGWCLPPSSSCPYRLELECSLPEVDCSDTFDNDQDGDTDCDDSDCAGISNCP